MFNICIDDYIIDFDLHQSYFLRDCLYQEISYELKESKVIIYKKLDSISEEISLDELIFYIHTEVAESIKTDQVIRGTKEHNNRSQHGFFHLFKDIDTIKKAVENMKIILKYDFHDNNDDEKDNNNNNEVEKKEDNETLAF